MKLNRTKFGRPDKSIFVRPDRCARTKCPSGILSGSHRLTRQTKPDKIQPDKINSVRADEQANSRNLPLDPLSSSLLHSFNFN